MKVCHPVITPRNRQKGGSKTIKSHRFFAIILHLHPSGNNIRSFISFKQLLQHKRIHPIFHADFRHFRLIRNILIHLLHHQIQRHVSVRMRYRHCSFAWRVQPEHRIAFHSESQPAVIHSLYVLFRNTASIILELRLFSGRCGNQQRGIGCRNQVVFRMQPARTGSQCQYQK